MISPGDDCDRRSPLAGLDDVSIDARVAVLPLASLTPAERAVALLAVEGLSNAEIAERRRATPKTVANQLRRVYAKLGVRSRFALVALLTGD